LVDREVNLPVFSTLFYSATYSSLLVKIGIAEEFFHFLLDKVFYLIILFKGIEIMSCYVVIALLISSNNSKAKK